VSTEAVAAGVRAIYGAAWPDRPTWICAVCLDDGRLVAFGREGSPPAAMAEAVAASCAIPAYFEPVVIGGRRYVDGGTHSVTNADLLAGAGLDLVVVSCPMGSTRDAVAMGLDLPLRAGIRMRLSREVDRVRRSGTPVLTLQPTREVRAAMGNNPMDPSRSSAVTSTAYESTLLRLKDDDVRERIAALA
jgi:NTE family protein